MSQLDETLAVGQAGHVAMHEQIATRLNRVFDVTEFGAVGDGATDDTAAIQAAITAAVNGGIVFIPEGEYRVTAALDVTDRVIIRGSSTGIDWGGAGTRLLPETTDQAVFDIGEGAYHTEISDLIVKGDGVATGLVGILYEGSTAGNPSDHSIVRNVWFDTLAKGIYANTTSGQWSITGVAVESCSFVAVTTGIHVATQNADAWHIDNCRFLSVTTGLYLERSGFVQMDTSYGSGAGGADDAFIRVETAAGPATIVNCQAESMDHHVVIESGVGNTNAPLTLIGNVVNNNIEINQNWTINFFGNYFTNDIDGSVTDARGFAAGNRGLDWTLTGANRLVAFDHDNGADLNMASIGFYGTTPIAQQTGVAVTTAGIHAALVALGLITA